jgi:hypothetical protein
VDYFSQAHQDCFSQAPKITPPTGEIVCIFSLELLLFDAELDGDHYFCVFNIFVLGVNNRHAPDLSILFPGSELRLEVFRQIARQKLIFGFVCEISGIKQT